MGKIIAYSMDHLMNSPDEEIRLKVIKLENQLYDYAGYVATLELEFKRIFDLKDNYGVNWYQSEFKKLDRKRREHHDDAIRALCALNRMCMAEALPLFYFQPVPSSVPCRQERFHQFPPCAEAFSSQTHG